MDDVDFMCMLCGGDVDDVDFMCMVCGGDVDDVDPQCGVSTCPHLHIGRILRRMRSVKIYFDSI